MIFVLTAATYSNNSQYYIQSILSCSVLYNISLKLKTILRNVYRTIVVVYLTGLM